MEKPSQVLLIDPPTELRFQGPFDKMVATEIKLKNPSDKKVCFKVKTTAPKRYFVRPNSGIIEPSKSELVKVSLQALDTDVDRAKHKFMVQSVFLPDGFTPIEDIWKVAKPDQLMESKLKCVFDEGVEAKETSPAATKEMDSEPITVAVPPEKQRREEPAYSKPNSKDPSSEVTRLQAELREAENKTKNLVAELMRREAENTHLRAEQRELRQRYMERSRQEEAGGDKNASAAAAAPADSTSGERQIITLTPQHLTLFALVVFFISIVIAKLFM